MRHQILGDFDNQMDRSILIWRPDLILLTRVSQKFCNIMIALGAIR